MTLSARLTIADQVQNLFHEAARWGFNVPQGVSFDPKKDCFNLSEPQQAALLRNILEDSRAVACFGRRDLAQARIQALKNRVSAQHSPANQQGKKLSQKPSSSSWENHFSRDFRDLFLSHINNKRKALENRPRELKALDKMLKSGVFAACRRGILPRTIEELASCCQQLSIPVSLYQELQKIWSKEHLNLFAQKFPLPPSIPPAARTLVVALREAIEMTPQLKTERVCSSDREEEVLLAALTIGNIPSLDQLESLIHAVSSRTWADPQKLNEAYRHYTLFIEQDRPHVLDQNRLDLMSSTIDSMPTRISDEQAEKYFEDFIDRLTPKEKQLLSVLGGLDDVMGEASETAKTHRQASLVLKISMTRVNAILENIKNKICESDFFSFFCFNAPSNKKIHWKSLEKFLFSPEQVASSPTFSDADFLRRLAFLRAHISPHQYAIIEKIVFKIMRLRSTKWEIKEDMSLYQLVSQKTRNVPAFIQLFSENRNIVIRRKDRSIHSLYRLTLMLLEMAQIEYKSAHDIYFTLNALQKLDRSLD